MWFPRYQPTRHRLPALSRIRWMNYDRWGRKMRDHIGTYRRTMIIPHPSHPPHPIPQKRSSRSRDRVRIPSLDNEITLLHSCQSMGRSRRRYRTATPRSRRRITCRRHSRIYGIREWGIRRNRWVRLRSRGTYRMMGSDTLTSHSMHIRDMRHTIKRIAQYRLIIRTRIHRIIMKDQKSGVRASSGNSGWRIL